MPIVLPIILATIRLSGSSIFSCKTSSDCYLNGECIAGTCHCDAAWSGPECNTFAFEKTDRNSGYHNQTAASWGGRPIFNAADGTYHMFVAQMVNRCGLDKFGRVSSIVRVVSKSFAGPYQYVETVRAPYGHNPIPIEMPNNGGILIYYIGGLISPSKIPQCNSNSSTEFKTKNLRRRALTLTSGSIHVIHAPSVYGPWSTPVALVFNDSDTGPGQYWQGGGSNPAPYVHPDGTVTMAVTRAHKNAPGKHLIGVARASSWRGPYRMLTEKAVEHQKLYCLAGTGEDPFLWRSHRGWHIIFHGMCPSGVLQAHYAFSTFEQDTADWTVSLKEVYSYDVRYTDGSNTLFSRVERPQLFFSNVTKQPVALFNGVCYGEGIGGIYRCDSLNSKTPVMTWTVVRPLKTM